MQCKWALKTLQSTDSSLITDTSIHFEYPYDPKCNVYIMYTIKYRILSIEIVKSSNDNKQIVVLKQRDIFASSLSTVWT